MSIIDRFTGKKHPGGWVHVDEVGEAHTRACPECGAEPDQQCTVDDPEREGMAIETGAWVHASRDKLPAFANLFVLPPPVCKPVFTHAQCESCRWWGKRKHVIVEHECESWEMPQEYEIWFCPKCGGNCEAETHGPSLRYRLRNLWQRIIKQLEEV